MLVDAKHVLSERVMSPLLNVEGILLNVVSGYDPQVEFELEECQEFWKEMDEAFHGLLMRGHFNRYVVKKNRSDKELVVILVFRTRMQRQDYGRLKE